MGLENRILMVTDSTQKLYCVGEVFWGQLPPLSEGSSTSRPLKGKREATGPCDWGPIQRTRTAPFPGVHPDGQGSAVCSLWRKPVYLEGVWHGFCP